MQAMNFIEITWENAVVPGARPGSAVEPRALKFRDEAVAIIAAVLETSGQGERDMASCAFGTVTARFRVDRFEVAEALVLEAIADTPYGAYSEIHHLTELIPAA